MSDSKMPSSDEILKGYAEMINQPDPRLYDALVTAHGNHSTPITVSVGGVIYSGIMVSERVWLEENLKLIQKTDFEYKQSHVDYYNDLISEYDANPHRPAIALHMKDVKIISHPTADMPIFLWRIRIDRVDAFNIGRMP
ncbi:hypothetical protein [Providencia huaxiensis]|uniref:hypothetical protein n=1 Tax=Providencia huaxiensis TaxID=2027290 RepID=UPI0034DD16C5